MIIRIEPGEAEKIVVKKGETLKFSTPLGGQGCDLVFLEFDQALTRNINGGFGCATLVADEGMALYDRKGDGILKIIKKKTASSIDLIFPGCFKELYEDGRKGCRDLLSEILGVNRHQLPAPVSLFCDVQVIDDTKVRFVPCLAKAGDYVTLKALKDVVIAVSCCPDDIVCFPNPSEIVVEKTN